MKAVTLARPMRSGPGVHSRSPSRTWCCGSTSQTVPQARASRQCGHRTNGPGGNASQPRWPGGGPAWRIWWLQMPGLDLAAAHADVLIPFGSVDPLVGEAAVRRARRLITEHGVRGFKFHPSLQAFSPDDRSYYPLYSVIEEAGLPAVFHTGQTGIGAGLPGGRGIKLRLSNPMLLDDVAADFPGMPVILAHPSVPWQDEAISIATHKAN